MTVGSPVWVSLSLFDRGALIWLVRNKVTLAFKTMKNAWHSSALTSEFEVYRLLEGRHSSVARFDGEVDVLLPGTDCVISTSSLRGNAVSKSDKSKVLRRVFYPSGRSLYKAESELELLKGIRAAIEGHEFLCNQQILHRNISVGSVMFWDDDDPQEGTEGLLLDLELARRNGPRVEVRTLDPVCTPAGQVFSGVQVKHSRWEPEVVAWGAPTTGTLQFMAVDLLRSLDDGLKAKHREVSPGPIEHQVCHDIESDPVRDLIGVLVRQFRLWKQEPFTHAAVLANFDINGDMRYITSCDIGKSRPMNEPWFEGRAYYSATHQDHEAALAAAS
ncbi:hypothetical protein CERSUDRAFT_76532 [Gelatoporia subvermispora B]|uniref:Fungal-type protein kinase domain-containing protein n=1 Tax=Ceriporiopsis subvermispora (strain B) TaxID=914234 RepID=M2PDH1_CERS8|nr:hypothetical protein CERSUDRAFT_76532 [Gelatoporia subvermispora B]